MKILHVINGEHFAGAERVQDLLAARFADFGVQCEFVALKGGEFARRRSSTHVPLHVIDMLGRFDLRSVVRIASLVRRGGFCAVHSHTPRSGLVATLAARMTGVRLYHHMHSPAARDSDRWLRNILNAYVENSVMRRAHRVIAVSKSLAAYGIKVGIDRQRLRVVPNGVPICEVEREWAEPKDCWTLAMVALFRPRKGLEVLLRSLRILHARGVRCRLHAIGAFETPEYESGIKELAKTLGVGDAVEWVGFTTDVDNELRRADVFVLPSLFGEGLPMALIEAMSAGIPVVGTRVEGVPEVVESGVNGELAVPGDAVSLADAIERLATMGSQIPELIERARQTQRQSFSDKAMTLGVVNVYREG